jgi:hypothetical protein
MIVETLTRSQFTGNETMRASFTYEAAAALYAYYMDFSNDVGEDIEFDPVGFRCDWSEYSLDELMTDYGHLLDDDQGPEDLPEVLENHTIIIKLPAVQTWLVMAF